MKSEETPKGRPWQRFACYFPLLTLGLEIPWGLLLFLGVLFTVGDEPYINTETKSRVFDFMASLPVVAGLPVGIIALAQKWPGRRLEWICLIAGNIGCAMAVACFAWGLVN